MSPLTAASRSNGRPAWPTHWSRVGTRPSPIWPRWWRSPETGQSLATMLISRNLALPGVVVGALAHLAQLPAVDLAAMTPSPEARTAMPDAVSQQFEAVGIQFDGNVLVVAFAEPPSQQDVDALASKVGFG